MMFSFWVEEVRERDLGRGRSNKMCLGLYINLLCVCWLLFDVVFVDMESKPSNGNLRCLRLTILNLNHQFLLSDPSFVSVYDLGFLSF